MKLESLVERAKKLKEKGLTTGEIADELNVSFETALWLLTRAKDITPSDIYIDWKGISKPSRMRYIALALTDMITERFDDVEIVVGVATSGIPLASMVAEELKADLSVYYPRKLKWESNEKHRGGVFSENYAKVDARRCVIVDDIISTGSTVKEVAEGIEKMDGKVLCAAVVVNKLGVDEIGAVPVLSMFKITRI